MVYSFTPADLIAAVGTDTNNSNPYYGNPSNNYSDSKEPFVFVNFFDTTGYFDAIQYKEVPVGAGYESDNHTADYVSAVTGTVLSTGTSVPEPASIGLFGLASLGLAGFNRRRKARLSRKP